jgi:hypothetical protein
MRAKVTELWSVIHRGDRIGPLNHFEQVIVEEYQQPAQPLSGKVIVRPEEKNFSFLFDSFILDKGSNEGIKQGDLFVTWHTGSKETLKRPSSIGCAAFVQPNYATVVVVHLIDNKLYTGSTAELIRRAAY